MATPKHGKPYIWVTWITSILSGEALCEYAPWFKAHYRYEQLTDGSFDTAAWAKDHAELVKRRAEELTREGYRVALEDQNAFKYEGKAGILGGKPDLVGLKYHGNVIDIADQLAAIEHVLLSDGKTGRKRNSDWWQVLIYMAIYRRWYPNVEIRGEVVYKDRTVSIGPHELTREREQQIWDTIKRVAGAQEPVTTASAGECRYCNIAECIARIQGETVIEGDEF